jgi:hypothetical protein
MDEVPISGEAIPRGVLAHGRNSDAIGKADRTKLEGGKKRNLHFLMDAGERREIQGEPVGRWRWRRIGLERRPVSSGKLILLPAA